MAGKICHIAGASGKVLLEILKLLLHDVHVESALLTQSAMPRLACTYRSQIIELTTHTPCTVLQQDVTCVQWSTRGWGNMSHAGANMKVLLPWTY